MKSGIKKGGKWTHKRMRNKEVAPFLRGQLLKGFHHLLVIGFETCNGFFTWEIAEGLGVIVQVTAHDQQADRISWFVPAGTFPTRQIALGHVNHVTHHIAEFPFPGSSTRRKKSALSLRMTSSTVSLPL